MQQQEFCDDAAPATEACTGLDLAACKAKGAAGSFCDATCQPAVFVDVSKDACDPRKQESPPTKLYGTPVPEPAQMIDLATVRLEAVVAGAACSGQGAPIVSARRVADLNGDGVPDLSASFKVQQASIQPGDNQACMTGSLRPVAGALPECDVRGEGSAQRQGARERYHDWWWWFWQLIVPRTTRAAHRSAGNILRRLPLVRGIFC